MVFEFLTAYFKRKPKFLLSSLKTLTNSDDCSESRTLNLCSGFPSLSLVSFLQCSFMIGFRKILGSQAAFGTTFESQAVIGKPVQAPRRGLLKKCSQLVVISQMQAETLF
jgi:hypothetical protein